MHLGKVRKIQNVQKIWLKRNRRNEVIFPLPMQVLLESVFYWVDHIKLYPVVVFSVVRTIASVAPESSNL